MKKLGLLAILFASTTMHNAYVAYGLDRVSEFDPQQFAIEMTDDKIIRLNKKTGKMSICAIKGEDLICRAAIDELDALNSEIDRLSRKVEKLEADGEQVAKRSDKAPIKPNAKDGVLEDEMERALEYSTKVMRRFFTVMKDFREDFEKEFN